MILPASLRPWLLVRPVFELTTSCSVVRHSPNWAYWGAVRGHLKFFQKCRWWMMVKMMKMKAEYVPQCCTQISMFICQETQNDPIRPSKDKKIRDCYKWLWLYFTHNKTTLETCWCMFATYYFLPGQHFKFACVCHNYCLNKLLRLSVALSLVIIIMNIVNRHTCEVRVQFQRL